MNGLFIILLIIASVLPRACWWAYSRLLTAFTSLSIEQCTRDHRTFADA